MTCVQSFVSGLILLRDCWGNNPRLILVGGLARSGKTVLSQQLVEAASHQGLDALRLPLDDWIVSVEKRAVNGTVRDRYEIEAMCEGVCALLEGREIFPPVYDVQSRRRVAERRTVSICPPCHLLVAEGVLALDVAPLRESAWHCLYIQTDPHVRRQRLERLYDEKGLSSPEVEELLRCREIDETPIVEASRVYADCVISM